MTIKDNTVGYLDNLTLEDPAKEACGLKIRIKDRRIQRLQWLEMLFYADKNWQEISSSRTQSLGSWVETSFLILTWYCTFLEQKGNH